MTSNSSSDKKYTSVLFCQSAGRQTATQPRAVIKKVLISPLTVSISRLSIELVRAAKFLCECKKETGPPLPFCELILIQMLWSTVFHFKFSFVTLLSTQLVHSVTEDVKNLTIWIFFPPGSWCEYGRGISHGTYEGTQKNMFTCSHISRRKDNGKEIHNNH